ncbi:MAG: GNAT family N-acetyltransferase [Pseudoruegeria sp.]
MSFAPTITTERLTLRHHQMEDFAPMAAIFATDWATYMGGPIDANEMWYWLGAEMASWQLIGFGSWAVVKTDTNELIGQVGINHPPRYSESELGWCIFPAYERKGFAFEAAEAARNWGFEHPDLQTFVSYIDSKNSRSVALAERLGATLDPQVKRPVEKTASEPLVYRHRRHQ